MSKVIKVIIVSLALVSVCASFSFTASASDPMNAYFNKVEGYTYNFDGSLVKRDWYIFDNSANEPGTSLIRCLYQDTTHTDRYAGFKIKLISNAFVRVESGYYFTYSLTITEHSGIYGDFDPKAYVVAEDDTVYDLNVSWAPEYNGTVQFVTITVGGRVGDGYPLRFGTLYLDFPGLYSLSSGLEPYTLICTNTFNIFKTPEQLRHDELTSTIQQSTEDILHGWNTDSTVTEDVADFSNEINDLESDALGGKTDDEIAEDVSSVLNTEYFPDKNALGVVSVSNLFDSLLDVFGLKYQSLLILALTLGLASVLVGRSFRARGD